MGNRKKRNSSIIRTCKDKNNPYMMMNKTGLEDPNLSFKAKGILAYLMSKPDDWKVVVKDLVNRSADGRDSVYSGINELKNFGYLEKYPVRDSKGRIRYWESLVYESPKTPTTPDTENPDVDDLYKESPDTENPDMDNPDIANPDIANPERNNNDYNNIDYTNINNNNNKPVVDTEIKKLRLNISKNIGNISTEQLLILIDEVGIKKINEYIEKFPMFKKTYDIKNPVGFFIKATKEGWTAPVASSSNFNNFNNFDQHDYNEKDLEDLYLTIDSDIL